MPQVDRARTIGSARLKPRNSNVAESAAGAGIPTTLWIEGSVQPDVGNGVPHDRTINFFICGLSSLLIRTASKPF